MYKCKQACAFQNADKEVVTFEKGKTYTKDQIAVVPKDVLKGDHPYFTETDEVDEEESTTTSTAKKGKKAKEEAEDEDGRV